jgi:hypothetical protein
MRSRSDIPPELARKAAAIDPALLRWLEAAYPTDEEQAERERRRRGQAAQLPIRFPKDAA